MGMPFTIPTEPEEDTRQPAALDALGKALEKEKDEAVGHRSSIEARWLANLRDYHDVKEQAPTKDRTTEQPQMLSNDNIVRQKVIVTAARLADMLFPTVGDNWDLRPKKVKPQPGVDPTMQAQTDDVRQNACDGMKQAITDQLEACNYAGIGRTVIDDACLYGTGVAKGPFQKAQQRRSWKPLQMQDGGTVHEVVFEADTTAGIEHVPVWDFFPQPARNMAECEKVFQLHLLTAKQVRSLMKQPGFSADQVKLLLKDKANLGTLAAATFLQRDNLTGAREPIKDRYPVWEYHGPFPREALDTLYPPEDGEERDESEFDDVHGEVWFSQGIVLKASISPIEETNDRLPYYVYNYEKDANDIFGLGVPDAARDDSIAIQLAHHAMLLNSMMSAGPQIGVQIGKLHPATPNGNVDLSCVKPRVWPVDEGDDINKILSMFTIPNVTGPLLEVINHLKKNARERTLMPYFEQEPPASVANTVGGLAMVLTQDNIVQRRGAKGWDDEVTFPCITAFYDWNMLHNPDASIKDDYEVIPVGSSHLLMKDMQAQHAMALLQLSEHPVVGGRIKPDKLSQITVDAFERSTGISLEGLLMTEEEVQGQQQPEDPKITIARMVQETAMAEIEKDREIALIEADTAALRSQAEIQVAGMKLAADEKITIEQVQERMQSKELDTALKARIADIKDRREAARDAAKIRLEAEKIVQKDRSEERQLAVESPVRLA